MRDAADGDRDDAEGGGGQGKWEGRVPRTGCSGGAAVRQRAAWWDVVKRRP